MSNPDTADVHIVGPVNGMGDKDKDGSYYKVMIMPTHNPRLEVKITGEQLSQLRIDCHALELDASE